MREPPYSIQIADTDSSSRISEDDVYPCLLAKKFPMKESTDIERTMIITRRLVTPPHQMPKVRTSPLHYKPV